MASPEPDADALRAQISALVEQYAAITLAPKPFVPGQTPVPPSGKVMGAHELQLLVEAGLDGWLTVGRFNEEFEQKLAARVGTRYALTVNSGSSANLVAFSTLTSPSLRERAIVPGDEVITVAAGFPTTVNPILQFGALPVFVDIDLETHNVDAALVEAAVTERTKAIVLAHALGNPFNLAAIVDICKRHELWLVEDCCDALGATYDGRPVGTFGDIATLSFYPAHHITMGEGGAVLTNSARLKLVAESFRDWGRDCYCAPGDDNTCGNRFTRQMGELPMGYDHKYTYSHLGYNLKITDMQAACGVAQLGRADEFIASRRTNHAYLKERLGRLQEYVALPEATSNSDPSWFGFAIRIRESSGVQRVDLLNYLDDRRIGTRLLFGGNLARQPYMLGRDFRVSGDLSNTDIAMNQTFWVGVHPALGTEHLDYVAASLAEFFEAGA